MKPSLQRGGCPVIRPGGWGSPIDLPATRKGVKVSKTLARGGQVIQIDEWLMPGASRSVVNLLLVKLF